jgi:hypothetical protein
MMEEELKKLTFCTHLNAVFFSESWITRLHAELDQALRQPDEFG